MGEVLTLYPTLGITAVMLVSLVGLAILEKRPHEFGQFRLPTTPLFFIALLVIMLMCAHLLTLVGAGHTLRC
ncbi:MAG: hypothetical protein V4441_01565 [Pseudomonadota bacterium]